MCAVFGKQSHLDTLVDWRRERKEVRKHDSGYWSEQRRGVGGVCHLRKWEHRVRSSTGEKCYALGTEQTSTELTHEFIHI